MRNPGYFLTAPLGGRRESWGFVRTGLQSRPDNDCGEPEPRSNKMVKEGMQIEERQSYRLLGSPGYYLIAHPEPGENGVSRQKLISFILRYYCMRFGYNRRMRPMHIACNSMARQMQLFHSAISAAGERSRMTRHAEPIGFQILGGTEDPMRRISL